MRYLSVCSGIEAASVAWKPLGWECAGVSEIDKFPRAVLEHRLGAVPVDGDHRWTPGQNFTPMFGDFTQIQEHHVGPVDLLVGGTPCQSFSIAGKRLGLDDPRGNLTLEFLALAKRVRARFIVWENVPGILSHDGGRTFGTFLGLLGECGYRFAYRVLDAQYTRVGRFGRAVPQRRRRVFVVGYSGTADINPAAVLFDRESLRGNPAPRRQAGERPAPTLAARTRGGGGLGTDLDCDGGLITAARMVAIGEYADDGVASAMKARDFKDATDLVAHSLRAEGFDASEDGTGRGTPIVPVQHPVAIQERAVSENPDAGPDGKGWRDDGAAYTLEARSTVQAVASAFTFNTTQLTLPQNGQDLGPDRPCHSLAAKDHPPAVAIAFSSKDHGADAMEDCSPTLRAGGHSESHANAGVPPAIAFAHQAGGKQTNLGFTDDGTCQTLGAHQTPAVAVQEPFTIMERGRNGESNLESRQDGTANAILTPNGGRGGLGVGEIAAAWGVRRLTPTECERLQGFPDGWTAIPWRGKPASECPDGPRYKSLGNSFAVNVITWIGERLQAVMEVENGNVE
ncbi:MAG: DNA (cytosine-5-)-methyltransferase [Armatimonadia bacterium]